MRGLIFEDRIIEARDERGFTLVELLVVVAIIGILAIIAIPQYAAYKARAYDSAALNDLRNIKAQLESFYVDNSKYPY